MWHQHLNPLFASYVSLSYGGKILLCFLPEEGEILTKLYFGWKAWRKVGLRASWQSEAVHCGGTLAAPTATALQCSLK